MIISDNYKLKDEIGSGTFGKVFIGEHTPTKQPIAVKVLNKEKIINKSDLQRVQNELQISQKTHSPHLVQLYDMLETDKYIFLIMEYLEGGELYDYIVASKRLSEQEAFKFFIQIISAVEYLHKLNIVHRDLKPENLLLDKDKKMLKLVDFGLGRFYNNDSKIETACGSPCYAPPEMLSRKKYEPTKADIWSLGIVLFAMLAGYLPFDEQDTDVLYQKIIDGNFEAPNWIRQETKEFLSLIINVNPDERISFEQIKQTNWYKDNLLQLKIEDPNFCCFVKNHSYFEIIDQEIIDTMVSKGCNEHKIQEVLDKKIQSDLFCYYHILKKQRGYQINQQPLQYNFKKQLKPAITFPKYSGPVDLEFVFCKAPIFVYQKLKNFFEENFYDVVQNNQKACLKISHNKKQISFEIKIYQFVNFEEGTYIIFDKIKPKKDILKKQLSNNFLKNLKNLFNQQ